MTARAAWSAALMMGVVAGTGACAVDEDPVDASASSTTSREPRAPHGSKLPPRVSSSSAGASATEESSGVPPFPVSTASQSAKSSGEGGLVLTDVRVGEHDGYDRLVLEFDGSGTPGWFAQYVDRPVIDGSGEEPDLDGDAFLDVYASVTTWPADGYYDGPTWLGPAGGALSGVYVAGTFEGNTQVIVGISGAAAPFRVFALPAPPRLVVDVADES